MQHRSNSALVFQVSLFFIRFPLFTSRLVSVAMHTALFAVGDGTHFSIKPPVKFEMDFVNYKGQLCFRLQVETLVDLYSCFDLSCVLGWHSMSAVGICDFGWRFLWVRDAAFVVCLAIVRVINIPVSTAQQRLAWNFWRFPRAAGDAVLSSG